MLFLQHIVDDSRYAFFIVATFKEIFLFFVIVIPLPQQFDIVLCFDSFLLLFVVLLLYPILEGVQFPSFFSNFHLYFFALLQNDEYFMVSWHLHVDLLRDEVRQQFVNFLHELVLLELEGIPLLLRPEMPHHRLLFIAFDLFVFFMFIVDFFMQQIHLP